MSIASYKDKVARRITGPRKPHCWPAAEEQVSPNHSYPDYIYSEYDAFNEYFYSLPKQVREKRKPEYEEMVDMLVWPLGGITCKDVLFSRATTVIGLKRILHWCVDNEFRIAVDLRGPGKGIHTIGLIPVEGNDGFIGVGNQVPRRLSGIITAEVIAPYLSQPNEPRLARYPWNDSNITALPAA